MEKSDISTPTKSDHFAFEHFQITVLLVTNLSSAIRMFSLTQFTKSKLDLHLERRLDNGLQIGSIVAQILGGDIIAGEKADDLKARSFSIAFGLKQQCFTIAMQMWVWQFCLVPMQSKMEDKM